MNKLDDKPQWIQDLIEQKPEDPVSDGAVQVAQEFHQDISQRVAKSDMRWWTWVLAAVILSSFTIGVFVGPAVIGIIKPKPPKVCRVITGQNYIEQGAETGIRRTLEECRELVKNPEKGG